MADHVSFDMSFFPLKLFQLTRKRIRVVQQHVLENETMFCKRRGRHLNRPHRLSDQYIALFYKHIEQIPQKEKHHTNSSSMKKYFKNSDLNRKKLYRAF